MRLSLSELREGIRRDKVALAHCEKVGDAINAALLREEIAKLEAKAATMRKRNPVGAEHIGKLRAALQAVGIRVRATASGLTASLEHGGKRTARITPGAYAGITFNVAFSDGDKAALHVGGQREFTYQDAARAVFDALLTPPVRKNPGVALTHITRGVPFDYGNRRAQRTYVAHFSDGSTSTVGPGVIGNAATDAEVRHYFRNILAEKNRPEWLRNPKLSRKRNPSQYEKVKALAERGSTEHERATAARILAGMQSPAQAARAAVDAARASKAQQYAHDAALLRTLREGDVVEVVFAARSSTSPDERRKLTVQGHDALHNYYVYVSSGKVLRGRVSGGAIMDYGDVVYYQPTMQQPLRVVRSLKRVGGPGQALKNPKHPRKRNPYPYGPEEARVSLGKLQSGLTLAKGDVYWITADGQWYSSSKLLPNQVYALFDDSAPKALGYAATLAQAKQVLGEARREEGRRVKSWSRSGTKLVHKNPKKKQLRTGQVSTTYGPYAHGSMWQLSGDASEDIPSTIRVKWKGGQFFTTTYNRIGAAEFNRMLREWDKARYV